MWYCHANCKRIKYVLDRRKAFMYKQVASKIISPRSMVIFLISRPHICVILEFLNGLKKCIFAIIFRTKRSSTTQLMPNDYFVPDRTSPIQKLPQALWAQVYPDQSNYFHITYICLSQGLVSILRPQRILDRPNSTWSGLIRLIVL